jgi:hypothetical protein
VTIYFPETRDVDQRCDRHEIKDHLEAAAINLGKQAIEVLHRPKDSVNPIVVSDVVSESGHGRRVDRRKPDRIDAQLHQIIQALQDSIQITNAVAITIVKRTRVDLIDDSMLPPD